MPLVLVLILAVSLPTDVAAEPDCLDWAEIQFWEQATAKNVRKCLDEGADFAFRNEFGQTPMHLAATYGKVEAMLELADAGADFDAHEYIEGMTPMHYLTSTLSMAVSQADRESSGEMRQLVVAGPNVSQTVLILVEAGADIDARDMVGQTPLHLAAMFGTAEIVQAMADAGSNINAKDEKGLTPLHKTMHQQLNYFTSMPRATEILLTLAEAGADVNARDNFGATPLHHAGTTHFGTAETTLALIRAGADVGVRDDFGRTPLHWASNLGSVETVMALLDSGADVSARDEDGATPIHDVAPKYLPSLVRPVEISSEIVLTLAEAGADVNARDEDGRTPLHWVALLGSAETVRALLDAGADSTARTNLGRIPAELAVDNPKIRYNPVFRELGKARFK